MFYKRICCFILASVLIVSSSACSNKGFETRTIDEKGHKVITFSCANLSKSDEGVLSIAVKKFEKENPDAVVDIKDLSKMGYDTDNYISTINTELMAGKGPDIMPISYLPIIKYYDKNIFTDLNEMIAKDKDFNKEKLLGNVLEASKYKGHLFAIPAYFSFNAISGSKETLDNESIKIDDKSWTTKDFIAIANQVTNDLDGDGTIDRYALPQLPMEAVTNLFINVGSYIDYENKKANFESSEFIELLKLLKSISDNKITHKKLKLSQLIPYKNSQEVVFSGGALEGYLGMLGTNYNLGGGERYFFRVPLVEKSEGVAFDSRMMIAINNFSKNKEYAWTFLKILLSEDIQMLFASSTSTAGFPINKNALAKQKINVSELDWRVKDEAEGWIPITFSKEELKFVDECILNINRYQISDLRLNNIVRDQIGGLFSNDYSFKEKDVEESAKNIQRKVQLYLEE